MKVKFTYIVNIHLILSEEEFEFIKMALNTKHRLTRKMEGQGRFSDNLHRRTPKSETVPVTKVTTGQIQRQLLPALKLFLSEKNDFLKKNYALANSLYTELEKVLIESRQEIRVFNDNFELIDI